MAVAGGTLPATCSNMGLPQLLVFIVLVDEVLPEGE